MKKIVTLCLLAASLCISAQNRKIALLEPRAGDGTVVSGMEKAMIRGELRKAIVEVDGYDAVTRSDIDQLMKEQDFQRTGNVRDDDIHRMGQMAGADYLCVSILNKSLTGYYIEAYFIDVETGHISNPSSQYGEVINGQMINLLAVCQLLANELIRDAKVREKMKEPIVETFDQNTWGWTTFTHNSNSAQIASGQLRLINNGNITSITCSDVGLPIDIKNDFKVTFRCTIVRATMFSSFGVRFGEDCKINIASGTTSINLNGTIKTTTNAKLGLGSNRSVIVVLTKEGDNITIEVNGTIIYSDQLKLATNHIIVTAGPQTMALLEDVRIDVLNIK